MAAADGHARTADRADRGDAERRPVSARELLLRAARMGTAEDDASLGGMEWPHVFALAERHRMIPLLHRHLADAPLPAEVSAELRARNRDEVHRALRLAAELRRLLAALGAAGIEVLAYKGPALAVQAYGDLSLRSFVDLDLLVRPGDVPRALGVLDAQGYAPALALSPAQERYFRRVDGDYPLVHRQTELLVELHARVSSERFCMPVETHGLMRRAQSVPVGGGAMRTLGDDDLLLVLCVHGAKHRWKRLEWLAAVAALLRGQRGDVATVLERATQARARRTVLLGLSLARRLLDAPLPPAVVREIEGDAALSRLADEAVRRMFEETGDEGEDTAANLAFNLRARDGTMDRARYAGRWLFGPSPEDWRWAHLPDALFPLYRVLRPVRLLMRHGGRRGG
ncbi:nucleotidyltransferase family protein [Longimicrobium sp.]|uniref:nucleotidyltransferase domain-containing protein n=1 Tax=Longimicrobium sp. TaxID=2029185 RepID=UPI002CEC86E9|nr:nucleotidyltransferase family protein [Longimicrobium sp.]HSU13331.1 nucleotidyltransferase family protein [Longimicrobium sp.]